MNKRRCINCGCKFYPQKHIANQKYCSKKECQNARRREWMRHKLKHDYDYKANRKEAQYRWRINNSDYWSGYKKNMSTKQKVKMNKTVSKKPTLKILVAKSTLINLRKIKEIDCYCRLIVASQKKLLR
jgi:hypothetical protein